ncbi:hypothetical protein [Mesorhizobium sp.]|uniref:hypothetical protein n=1 Tax=Mesorhizobium sp. TaxID=1871066 RepID=UPI00345CD8A5
MRSGPPRKGLSIVPCASPQEAVEGADITTTAIATNTKCDDLVGHMVGPGVHINAVGGDCPGKTELHRDILLRSDIFVEYPPQTRIEGEIQQLDADHPVTELWAVRSVKTVGRQSDRSLCSTGSASQSKTSRPCDTCVGNGRRRGCTSISIYSLILLVTFPAVWQDPGLIRPRGCVSVI